MAMEIAMANKWNAHTLLPYRLNVKLHVGKSLTHSPTQNRVICAIPSTIISIIWFGAEVLDAHVPWHTVGESKAAVFHSKMVEQKTQKTKVRINQLQFGSTIDPAEWLNFVVH